MEMPSFQYEDAAQAFLQDFPIDTTVRGDEIVKWAHDHKDGLASDLLIDNPTKKLSALRRHLNAGASSRSFDESERYVLEVIDAKRKIFMVRRLVDHVGQKADAAFGKSIFGCINPLKNARAELEDVKVEELDDNQRRMVEAKLNEIIETQTPIKKMLGEQMVARLKTRLIARGFSEEAARTWLELLPTMGREIKLLRALQ